MRQKKGWNSAWWIKMTFPTCQLPQLNRHFLFFQETHSTANEVKFWRSQWGNDIWLSHGSEHSAGVGTLKCNFTGNILYSDIDINGNFVCQVIDFNRIILIVTNVYGYNSKAENEILFDNIEQKLLIWLDKFPNAFLLVGGDFNVVTTTQILATPLTDHKTIHISIPLSSSACHNCSSYWKLNSSIVIYEDVKVEV